MTDPVEVVAKALRAEMDPTDRPYRVINAEALARAALGAEPVARLVEALGECEEAMLPVLGTDPRRVIRTDVDNFPSEYRFTAKEREALIEAVHEVRAALEPFAGPSEARKEEGSGDA